MLLSFKETIQKSVIQQFRYGASSREIFNNIQICFADNNFSLKVIYLNLFINVYWTRVSTVNLCH